MSTGPSCIKPWFCCKLLHRRGYGCQKDVGRFFAACYRLDAYNLESADLRISQTTTFLAFLCHSTTLQIFDYSLSSAAKSGSMFFSVLDGAGSATPGHKATRPQGHKATRQFQQQVVDRASFAVGDAGPMTTTCNSAHCVFCLKLR